MKKSTKEQQELLQRLADEITNLATEVVQDYELNPSEMSGSIVEVHQDSPLLVDENIRSMGETCIHGNSWHSNCSDCDEMGGNDVTE